MESSLRVRTFERLPSSSEFESLIESTNVPAVFKGCVSDWKALSNWSPSNGGLDYLQERVGLCVVEAMLSKSAHVFYGDLRSHERVPLLFSGFVGLCKRRIGVEDGVTNSDRQELERNGTSELDSSGRDSPLDDDLQQAYLAQVPIMHFENEDRNQLQMLKQDICTPILLEGRDLASINLWMNSSEARSSTHYDPHHNLLCLVAGRKQVTLWPPSASPMLYPMPIYGEASNHSSLSLENPDLSVHPRAKCLMKCSQKVILHEGDALYIPEGWFHQVDSDHLTIAVNFWWRSKIMSGMSEHMDAYYLRRILRRLADREMSEVFSKAKAHSAEIQNTKTDDCEPLGSRVAGKCDFNVMSDSCTNKSELESEEKGIKVEEVDHRTSLNELDPLAVQALHALVSLVHDRINVSDCGKLVNSTSTTNSAATVEVEDTKATTSNSFSLQDDPVAKILWNTDSSSIQHVFLAMAHNFPRTLEALVIHLLSPVAAEVLTRKFDELDQLITEKDRNKFYEVFYGAFEDQFAAMDSILNGKESFAQQALNSVLEKYLGVNYVGTR